MFPFKVPSINELIDYKVRNKRNKIHTKLNIKQKL